MQSLRPVNVRIESTLEVFMSVSCSFFFVFSFLFFLVLLCSRTSKLLSLGEFDK